MTTEEKIKQGLAYLSRRYVERGNFLSDSDVLTAADGLAPVEWDDAGRPVNIFAFAQNAAIRDALYAAAFSEEAR